MFFKRFLPLATVALTVAGTYASAAFAADGNNLSNARDATAIYQTPAAAVAAGYELLTDAAGIACIDDPQMGAMGVHYVKGALVGDGAIDPARPEALVYQVSARGQVQLVALEYVVIQSAWDSAHSSPPSLFGQNFMLTPAGNRFGLPAFYSLHTWIYERNPSGMFAPFNPRVDCASEIRAENDLVLTAEDPDAGGENAHGMH
jgi:hypothetical protein